MQIATNSLENIAFMRTEYFFFTQGNIFLPMFVGNIINLRSVLNVKSQSVQCKRKEQTEQAES